MKFYQAYGDDFDGEYYQKSDSAIDELKELGYDTSGLKGRYSDSDFPLYDPDLRIGIAVVHI